MPLSPWKHLRSLSGNSGSFPAGLLPAEEIAFSYAFQDNFDVGLFVDGSVVKLGAKFEVNDASGNPVLHWGFTVNYVLLQGTLFFVYYAASQTCTVTYPVGGVPTLGDPSGIAIPGGGSGGGLGGLDFQEEFQSPVFKVKIPAGSTCKIVFHTAGYPSLSDIAGLTVRTLAGAAGLPSGFRHGRDGEAFVLFPGASDWQTARAYGRDRTLTTPLDTTWKPDGAAFTVKAASGTRQWAVYQLGTAILLRHSDDDGGTWSDAVTIYTGYTLLGVARQDGGGLVALLADSAGRAYYFGYGDRSGNWSDPPTVANVPAGTTLAPGLLLASGNTLDFFWPPPAGGLGHIKSTNDAKDWT